MAINVPITKNGPKGTSDFKVFLPATISPIPIIAPIKKARNRATKIFGQPKNKPIKKASLKSPRPIHFPREKIIIAKKKTDGKIPNPPIRKPSASNGAGKFKIVNNRYKKAIAMAG